MDDRTKQSIRGAVEQDADKVLMVAVGEGESVEESQVVADLPRGDLPRLIGMLLVGAEESLEIPAPLVAYEASKYAEQFGRESSAIIYQDLDGGDSA